VEDALLDHNGVLGRVLTEVRQREVSPGEHDEPYPLVTANREAEAVPGPKSPVGRSPE
jgi:hypothetical protein